MELLGEVSQRHGLVVTAYVLMDNHYHLVVRTLRANLSQAMQWFNMSYAFSRIVHWPGKSSATSKM